MRHEGWTSREAEVRLGEQEGLRRALGLGPVPDFTTLNRPLHRLPGEVLARALEGTVRRMGCPPGPAQVAVDAAGPTPGAVSTFFVKRLRGRGGVWRRWTKWVAVDVSRQVVLAQSSHLEAPGGLRCPAHPHGAGGGRCRV